ncbi:CotH kinase family protein [Clostridium sp. MSJ-8]|uniref:CotH kinase family protein n=1 Tax=Clostridium sp. MSJ-8 TaxID=2841510 RepID=UPI001C0F207B|nr:CotH kinase family protein [Clostridium sp. MSJ-8]MBU5488074.1 CotH kinase family protein [Clostridium sp. MSJ-8]
MKSKKIISIIVTLSMLTFITPSTVYAANMPGNNSSTSYTHGSSTTVTEDMLFTEDDIPDSYDVNNETQGKASSGAYTSLFNDESVENVYIDINENNWNYMLQNAIDKPNVLTNSVTIGGQTVQYASIKTKGNLTLSSVWNSDSDRFSFTVNFGKYIKKKNGYSANQNLYGLSKVSFNNIYGDSTLMKEYLSYKLMTEMGIPTPCYSLVNLYVNGEFYGVYMMVESVDSALTQRTLNEKSDYLVKPESSGGDLVYDSSLDQYYNEETGEFEFTSSDYPTDSSNPLYKYNGLWENDEDTFNDIYDSLSTVFKWMKTLNELSNSENPNTEEYKEQLESIMDVDNVIRYFAVNTYLVNLDSYQSEKMQNYALYINDEGYMHILPWDYNYSFGAYGVSNASAMVNFNIYNPLVNCTLDERPLLNVILQNDEYKALYESYLNDCCTIASEGGTTSDGTTYSENNFENIINSYKTQLTENYSNDPTAFYTVDQYTTASTLLSELIAQRSEAVLKQLSGDTEEVSTDINLNLLGNVVGGSGNMPGGNPGITSKTITDETTGISITGTFPDNATLSISNITDGDNYDLATNSIKNVSTMSLYNISMNMGGNFDPNNGGAPGNPPSMNDNGTNQNPPNMNDTTQTQPDNNQANNAAQGNQNNTSGNQNNNNQQPNNGVQQPDNNMNQGNNPNGPEEMSAQISFPITLSSNETAAVYYLNSDGAYELIDGTYSDGVYTITTNNITNGVFALTTTKTTESTEDSTNNSTSDTTANTTDSSTTTSSEKTNTTSTTTTTNADSSSSSSSTDTSASSKKTSDNNKLKLLFTAFAVSATSILTSLFAKKNKKLKDSNN